MVHFSLGVRYFCYITFLMICLDLKAGDIPSSKDAKSQTIMLPYVLKPWETRTSVSLSFTRLPVDWVETSVQVPIVQVRNKLGFPAGFTLESSLQTILVSNQLRSGPHWNFEKGWFSFGVGFDAAILYGKMSISGFDNRAYGWCTYPSISIGFTINDIAFTLSGEYSILQSLKMTSGDVEISESKNFKSGQTLSLFMEQKFWKQHVLTLGFINNFQKFYFLTWPAFSTFNRRYYIPQFYIGLVL